jgi:F-box and WD-40 domain protein CDC4
MPTAGTVTSTAMDSDWLVVGLANTKIHIFSARTGVLARTLVGHESGVWAVSLISKGGGDARPDGMWVDDDNEDSEPLDDAIPKRFRTALGLDQRKRKYVRLGGMGKKSDSCGASDGWGQPNALVVSSGCDKIVRVWDVKTGLVSLFSWSIFPLLTLSSLGTVYIHLLVIHPLFGVYGSYTTDP